MYAVYILLCSDNSYYTGLTNDLEKRIWQYETGFFPECYTYKRRPVKLILHTIVETADEANNLEKQIKGWSRKKKEALMQGNIEELKKLSDQKKESPFALRQAQGKTEFLIIGQGISGTWLSYFLHKENRSFLVIDNNDPNTSSRIAAGIINPVTGRRLVTVWMDEEILPFSNHIYHEIGNELGIQAISQKNIIDFFPNPQMMQTFLQRTEEGCKYLHPYPDQNNLRSHFNFDFACGEIDPAYIVHLDVLLPAWRKFLLQKNILTEDNFDLSQVKYSSDKIQYKDITADKIIFCDGINSFTNPLFQRLPFAFNKGEMLLIEAPEISSHHIYKKNILMAPLQHDNVFWAGTNYIWDYNNDLPTKDFREKTEQALKQWLKVPFKILDHKASIRPANVERRPFVGMHPVQKNAGILNGMGSKGCSLAPYFAKQLADHLIYKKEILPEASIDRFRKILSH